MVRDDEWGFYDKNSNTSLCNKSTKMNKTDIIKDVELSAILRGDVNASYNVEKHNCALDAELMPPYLAPLPINNDDKLLIINPDIV